MMENNKFLELLSLLNEGDKVIVQTHDYPDPDSIASGAALNYLLKFHGFDSVLQYGGKIQTFTIESSLEEFEIGISEFKKENIQDNTKIILVDCHISNKNVNTKKENVLGFIDHHKFESSKKFTVFEDLRQNYGSCSTIIYTYFKQNDITIPKNIASMLLMGIIIDTSFLTRGVNQVDFETYFHLYTIANSEKVLSILKNSMSISYLATFKEAIDNFEIKDNFCFVSIISKKIIPELLAIVADFFIGMKEADFVVVLGLSDKSYRLSVRSLSVKYPASIIISEALEGIGYGGGHYHMGGGSIEKENFNEFDILKEKFFNLYMSYKKVNS